MDLVVLSFESPRVASLFLCTASNAAEDYMAGFGHYIQRLQPPEPKPYTSYPASIDRHDTLDYMDKYSSTSDQSSNLSMRLI